MKTKGRENGEKGGGGKVNQLILLTMEKGAHKRRGDSWRGIATSGRWCRYSVGAAVPAGAGTNAGTGAGAGQPQWCYHANLGIGESQQIGQV